MPNSKCLCDTEIQKHIGIAKQSIKKRIALAASDKFTTDISYPANWKEEEYKVIAYESLKNL